MNLNLLRSFMAVYRNRSFSKSAEELGLSQPGVTAQIQALEQQLGRQLFKRSSKGAEPLPFAHRLAEDVRAELTALERTWAQHLPGGESEPTTVFIGGPAEMLGTAVMPALGECLAHGIEVHIAHGFPADLAAGVREGRFDLAICTTEPTGADLVWKPMFTEEFVLVAAPDYAPVQGMSEEDRAAGRFPDSCRFIAYDPGLPVIRRYWRMVYKRVPGVSGSIIVPDLRSVLQAVTAGLGISVLPLYLCACEIERGQLTVLHRPDPSPSNVIYLMRSRSKPMSEAVRHVHDVFLESAKHW
jgi:DNA-binding transcriptional LysR family regulator